MAGIVDDIFGTPTGDAALILGDVFFQHFEVPEVLNYGGDQLLSVHQLVGGKRIINALGRSDRDITWSGMFYGETAFLRAQALDFLRTQGIKIELLFGGLLYFGIIKTFDASLERFYQIPYSITFMVIENLSIPVPIPPPAGYDDAVNADSKEAGGLAADINVTSLSAAVAAIQASIKSAGKLGSATPDQLNSILDNIQSTQAINEGLIASNPMVT